VTWRPSTRSLDGAGVTGSGPNVRGALVPVSPVGPRVTVSVGAGAVVEGSAGGGVDAGIRSVGDGLWIAGASGGVDSAPASDAPGGAGTTGDRDTSGAALTGLSGSAVGAAVASDGASTDHAMSDSVRGVGMAGGVPDRAA